jgi:hypothetical protein
VEDEELKVSIKIYPNPVVEVLSIALSDDNKIISGKIYDLAGKQVFQDNSNKMHLGHLSNGIYLLMLETTKGNLSKRIVKK